MTLTTLLPEGRQRYYNNDGTPCVGGKLWTYAAGTTNPKPTYADVAGTVANPNPVPLDAHGEAVIYWSGAYKVDLKQADGQQVTGYPVDNVSTDPAGLLGLLTAGGADLVGYQTDSVRAALDSLRLTDYAALRNYAGPQLSVFVTGYYATKDRSGIAGMFVRADYDTTTADNGGWCIVDKLGRRWKRPNHTTVNPLWFGAIDDYNGTPGTSTDNAAAINAAIASFPKQGTPNWRSWALELTPTGTGSGYYVGSTINVKNQQFGRLIGKGATLVGNFDGPVLQLGDLTGANDILWFHLEGLNVQQYSAGLSAIAVQMQHAYSCTVEKCFFYGGRFAFVLDGNANQISACTFRAAITANVTCAGGANNETNTFLDCSNELGKGYGYDLNVNAGVGGFTRIVGGYCEANATANIRVKNNQKFVIDGVYFNLQNGAPAIQLDGTVGAIYPSGYGTVQNCRVLGNTSGTAPKFIQEIDPAAVNCSYRHNELEAGTNCDMYGAAGHCVNRDRRRKMIALKNAVDFTDANADGVPDGWTRQGTGAVAIGATISPYGVGSSVAITTANSYIHQDVKFPANVLLRISAYVQTTGADARLELWTTALSGAYATVLTASATPQRVEMYVPASVLAGATTAKLLLRTRDAGTATFSDIEFEDMST